jgi:hypothetical protein
MKHWTKRTITTLLLVLLVSGLAGGSVYGNEPLEAKILRLVAMGQDVSVDRLQISSLDARVLPLTGVTLYQAKVVDLDTGEVYGLAVDEQGTVRDLEGARLAERIAHRALYGRLHPALYDRLQAMAEDERLTVAVWLKAENLDSLERPDHRYQPSGDEAGDAELPPPDLERSKPDGPIEEVEDPEGDPAALEARVAAYHAEQAEERARIEAFERENRAHLVAQVADLQAPLLADLAARGIEPIYVSPIAPLIYVEMDVAQIFELAQRDDVDTVYGPNENYDLMGTAKPTQKADVVDAFGFDGTGVDVAILEDSRIEFTNPYLNAGTTRVPGDSNVDQHATACAGMVASQHSTYQGIAQGVYIYSANATDYTDANLSAAMDWAEGSAYADIINNSWGGNAGVTTLNEHDRHLDYIARYSQDTVTVSAGNEGTATGRVTSPARGYNVISVGAYGDNNTLTWASDAMASYSSYADPSTGCEKPEVAASGSSIDSTTHLSPWTGPVGSGTSYAAPMVAGEAALLLDVNSALFSDPEAVKAMIMATALHNIEGSSRLSEYDGAGGVDMLAAFRAAGEGWSDHRYLDAAGDLPYDLYVYAYAGETVRAAIAWDSTPTGDYTSDPLVQDIDLRAYNPSGGLVASSASSAYSFEIVEFTASTTGNYRLEVSLYGTWSGTTYIGAAWWPGHRVLSAYASQSLGTPPIWRDYFRFDGSNMWWHAVGIRSPGNTTTENYNIYLYDDSAFGNPADHGLLEDSTLSAVYVDYVLVDRNHAPSQDYFVEVRAIDGTGSYPTEWARAYGQSEIYSGTYGPYTMANADVVRVWDSSHTSGVRKYYAVKPTSGSADLGMALHNSNDGTFLYQGRSNRVVQADINGAGAEEYMSYESTNSDWLGLVVWNNGAASTSQFYLYADTTAPSGSIAIDGGNTYCNSTSVTLDLSGVSDSETGVTEMRFSNNGSSWSGWEPYAASKSWSLLSGDGTKTVYAQFRNNAGMTSGSISDSIVLDTTAPSSSASSPATTEETSFDVSWSGTDNLSGIDTYWVQYRVGSGGTWTDWQSSATASSATFGPASPVTVERDQTYYFRARAEDNAGNVESWPGGDGDSETYVEMFKIYLPVTLKLYP